MPTTYDIAKLAKVNQSTVSRVLSGSPHVKKGTAQKVWRACRKLRYVPNAPARSLRTQQARAVAVHLPLGREVAFADPFVPMFLAGVHEQAARRSYSVVLSCEAAEDLSAIVTGRRADGVILTSLRRGDERIEALGREFIPCVLGRYDGSYGPKMACVDIDNRRTGALAVRFLHRGGHREIGLVCETEEWTPGADFHRGAQAEAQRLGVHLAARNASPTFDAACAAARNILAERPGASALIATTALTVFGVLEAVQNAAHPVMVLGVDSQLLRNLHPRLPRIVSPIYEMGQAMTAAVIDLIETGQAPPPRMLQANIVDEAGNLFSENFLEKEAL